MMYASSDNGVCAPNCSAGDVLEVTIVDWEKLGCCPSYWKCKLFYMPLKAGMTTGESSRATS